MVTMWSYGEDYTPFNVVDRMTLERMYQLFLKNSKMNKLTLPNGLTVDFESMEVQDTKDVGYRSEAFSEFGLKREKAPEDDTLIISYPIQRGESPQERADREKQQKEQSEYGYDGDIIIYEEIKEAEEIPWFEQLRF